MAMPLRYRQHTRGTRDMPTPLRAAVKHLVIGAGVHGLSTAWHLARAGEEVVVVDKTGVAAGASGIACGVVRNNYFQPAMSELMAACVEIWESDPDALHYHGSGYVALGPPSQEPDLVEVFERQQRLGYPSELHTGEDAVRDHMSALYPDWRAPGLTVCLHEHAGGFAFNRESMLGLADKARAAGAQIVEGVEATGFESDGSGAVTTVRTSAGDVAVEQVVIAVGPWIATMWERLELPRRPDVRTPDGTLAEGPLITDEGWGIYLKPDRGSAQGGAEPIPKGHEFDVDPYPTGTVDPGFPDMWCAALSHCLGRFEGVRPKYRQVRSGGVGAFTVDNFPVFDYMRPNVYVAADSNHGYKMIAVGREIARVLTGEHSALLHPFRFERFATGELHPVSNSPYPWS